MHARPNRDRPPDDRARSASSRRMATTELRAVLRTRGGLRQPPQVAEAPTSAGIHRSEGMIEHTLDSAHSILYVRPKSKLEQGDFVQLAKTVDPHIEEKGDLAGLIIEVTSFPGWESLGAMAS